MQNLILWGSRNLLCSASEPTCNTIRSITVHIFPSFHFSKTPWLNMKWCEADRLLCTWSMVANRISLSEDDWVMVLKLRVCVCVCVMSALVSVLTLSTGTGVAQWYSAELRAGCSGVRVLAGGGKFLFTTASRLALGPIQPPIQWVQGFFPWG
jgi:hypothetical protein